MGSAICVMRSASRLAWQACLVILSLATPSANAAPGEPTQQIDQEWRDRFVMQVDADAYRNATKAWDAAREALEVARAKGDQRAELRAAANYFMAKPKQTVDDCSTFQRYLGMARAGGTAFDRELFDLGAATAWTWFGRTCAGQLTAAELETLAKRLGDPARLYYVIDAQAVDAQSAARYGELSSMYSKQLDYAIAPFQRAKSLLQLADGDFAVDRQSTTAIRWLDRARQEFDPKEFQGLAFSLDTKMAVIEFRRKNVEGAMAHVKRVLAGVQQGAASAQNAAVYLASFARYLNRLHRPHDALKLLEESRRFDADDPYTQVSIAGEFLVTYAKLGTPAALAKGEQEVRTINELLKKPFEAAIARVEALRGIAEFYERFGRLDAALQTRKALEQAMDDAQERAADSKRVEWQEQLNVALKDQENAQLKAQAELQEIRQRGWVIAFGMAALSVMGVGSALAVVMSQRRRLAQVSAELEQRNGELEQRSASRIRLLAAACHDLRQPAHALGMLAELGGEADKDPQRFSAWLQSVRRSTASLGDMLDELMDLGRLDSGHYQPQLGDVPLGELMQEVMLHFGPLARRKGLTLEAPPVECTVVSDRHLLRRIVFNLVSNAIKYTDSGVVRILMQASGQEVKLTVQDTGPGIPQDKLDDVFRDYVRLNPLKAAEGLGIGLSIVRRAAELLGHGLTLASQPGAGTSASLTLPLREAAEQGPQTAALPQTPTATGALLAVIENDADVREAMTALLRSWGYAVIAGARAGVLLGALGEATATPDLVISDLHLDGTDGLAEIAQLREVLQAPLLPALLVTGDLDDAVTAQAAQAQIYVAHKPLAPRTLAALVSQLLLTTRAVPEGSSRQPATASPASA